MLTTRAWPGIPVLLLPRRPLHCRLMLLHHALLPYLALLQSCLPGSHSHAPGWSIMGRKGYNDPLITVRLQSRLLAAWLVET